MYNRLWQILPTKTVNETEDKQQTNTKFELVLWSCKEEKNNYSLLPTYIHIGEVRLHRHKLRHFICSWATLNCPFLFFCLGVIMMSGDVI